MQLIKLHVGLVRYLIKELPKKKTPKEVIEFLNPLIGVYLKELLKLYKNIFLVFDREYQTKKNEYNKYQKIKVDLQRCLKMLQYLDKKMEKQGIPRWKRRQFWRDFHKNGQVRKEEFDALLKEIG
jgi:hypothetical protein